MTAPPDTLSPATAAAWDAWCAAEQGRARAERDTAAAVFLEAIAAEPADVRTAFAEWWCRATLGEIERSGGGPVPFRLPLLARIVAPVLADGRGAGRPGSARWTAGLGDRLRKLAELGYEVAPVPEFEELMAEALAADPDDRRAMRGWLSRLLGRLDYGLHELPALLEPAETLREIVGRAQALAEALDEIARCRDYLDAVRALLDAHDAFMRAVESYESTPLAERIPGAVR